MCADNFEKFNIDQVNSNKIGELIRNQRKRKKYTQEQVSEAIGISDKHYSKIEIGKYIPSVPTFFKILEFLEFNLDDFSKHKVQQRKVECDIAHLIKDASDEDLELCFGIIKLVLNKS